ncbi:MAG: hypothetical protein ABIU30_21615 [Ferruginibacter sp.]
MPKSHIRKKSKKRKKSVPKIDEVFDGGWYEVTRSGKNVFSRLKMTKEEHEQWINQIKDNLPKFQEEIKTKIRKVVDLINSYDKIFVLGGIASIASNKMITIQDDNSDAETAMEYAQSIAMATDNSNKGKRPDSSTLDKIYSLLTSIRSDFQYYYGFEHLNATKSKIESDIRFKMISESLLIRGEGYMCHIKELFKDMFSLHDDFFQKHYGFKSNDIIRTFEQLESSFTLRVASPIGEPHPFLEFKLNQWKIQTQGNGNYPEDFAKQNPGIIVEEGKLRIYPISYIEYFDKLYGIRHFDDKQKSVVKALSLKFGENKVFTEHSVYEVINESKIFTYPIVEDENGNFYLFSMNIAARNYFGIAMNLIRIADSSYFSKSFQGSRIAIAKDNFMEQKVKELFQRMLPGVQFYKNVKYNYPNTNVGLKCTNAADGNYELDCLGISNDATFLIEVKSGILSDKAKRGAILSLQSDLTKLIGDAICQSFRAFKYVTETSDPSFITEEQKKIGLHNKENVYRISVSFSYVGSLISSLSKLQQFGVIEPGAEFGWVINVHDLMVFSEIIDSEFEFIDYLNKRLPLYKDERLHNVDETALLGLYYSDDLKIDKQFEKSTSVQLDSRSYLDEIDAYFDFNGPRPRKQIKK